MPNPTDTVEYTITMKMTFKKRDLSQILGTITPGYEAEVYVQNLLADDDIWYDNFHCEVEVSD